MDEDLSHEEAEEAILFMTVQSDRDFFQGMIDSILARHNEAPPNEKRVLGYMVTRAIQIKEELNR